MSGQPETPLDSSGGQVDLRALKGEQRYKS